MLKELRSIISCKLFNKRGKPAFKLKEKDSYTLYKFVITIIILLLIAIIVANILININIISALKVYFIIVSRAAYKIATIKVASTRSKIII